MIVPGFARDLLCHVVIVASGLDKTSGTIYSYVRRDSDGFWLNSSNAWQAAVPTAAGGTLRTATFITGSPGLWKDPIPAAVTSALPRGTSVVGRMTDNETAASATVTSDVVEHIVEDLGDDIWDDFLNAGTRGVAATVNSIEATVNTNLDAQVSDSTRSPWHDD